VGGIMNQDFKFNDDREIVEFFARNENKLKLINFIDNVKKKYFLENLFMNHEFDKSSANLISGRLIYREKLLICSYRLIKPQVKCVRHIVFKFCNAFHATDNITDKFIDHVELSIQAQINYLNEIIKNDKKFNR
jgi:hypothetical protein